MKIETILLLVFITIYGCSEDRNPHKFNNPIVWESSKTTPNRIYNGIDYILKGFENFDIVAIGESHGIKEVTDFYIELVSNDNFRKNVDVIVFELGNSLYQEDLDNYIFGTTSDTLTIKNLWRDHTSSFLQSGDRTGVSRFFKEVRKINIKSEHKVRILAAEPPIVWSKINSSEELFEFIGQRDRFYGDLVKSEVLKKNKKALLIMGSGHFNKCKPAQYLMDNPIAAVLKTSNKNLVLINTMTTDEFPYGQLPNMREGEVIETLNPIIGDLKLGTPFLKDHPLKVQTDALLYLGIMQDLEFEMHTPFNDLEYENELNRRKEIINIQ